MRTNFHAGESIYANDPVSVSDDQYIGVIDKPISSSVSLHATALLPFHDIINLNIEYEDAVVIAGTPKVVSENMEKPCVLLYTPAHKRTHSRMFKKTNINKTFVHVKL